MPTVPRVGDCPGVKLLAFHGQSSPARWKAQARPMLAAERAAAIPMNGRVLARTGGAVTATDRLIASGI